jgi:hypothetical protein
VLNLSSNSLEKGLDRVLPLSTLSSLLLDNNNLQEILPELGAMPNLRSITLHGNPQRTVRSNIIEQGTDVILRYLKDKIILSSLSPSADIPVSTAGLSEVQSLQTDIEALETRLLDRSISSSKMYTLSQLFYLLFIFVEAHSFKLLISPFARFALKKELAMKKASLIRLRRKEDSL